MPHSGRRLLLIPLVALVAIGALALRATRQPDRSDEQRRPTPHLVFEDLASTLPLRGVRLLTPRLVSLAAKKGRSYWGGTLCDNGIGFRFRPLADSRLAEASWEVFPGAERRYLDCHVTFDANPTRVETTFVRFCAAVVHEYGHLSGHGHVANPRSIMSPVLSAKNVPATCERLD